MYFDKVCDVKEIGDFSHLFFIMQE